MAYDYKGQFEELEKSKLELNIIRNTIADLEQKIFETRKDESKDWELRKLEIARLQEELYQAEYNGEVIEASISDKKIAIVKQNAMEKSEAGDKEQGSVVRYISNYAMPFSENSALITQERINQLLLNAKKVRINMELNSGLISIEEAEKQIAQIDEDIEASNSEIEYAEKELQSLNSPRMQQDFVSVKVDIDNLLEGVRKEVYSEESKEETSSTASKLLINYDGLTHEDLNGAKKELADKVLDTNDKNKNDEGRNGED